MLKFNLFLLFCVNLINLAHNAKCDIQITINEEQKSEKQEESPEFPPDESQPDPDSEKVDIDFPQSDTPTTSTNSNDSCSRDDLSATERVKCCDQLNKQRKSFTTCCEYPMMVVYDTWRQKCVETCSKVSASSESCCILNCCLKKLKILSENPRDGINPEAMSRSFLMSVYNDTKWTYPIMSSVAVCYAKNAVDKKALENEENMGCDGLVPKYFYDVVDCAYNRNFISCPYWNPKKEELCDVTKKYVMDCIIVDPKDAKQSVNVI